MRGPPVFYECEGELFRFASRRKLAAWLRLGAKDPSAARRRLREFATHIGHSAGDVLDWDGEMFANALPHDADWPHPRRTAGSPVEPGPRYSPAEHGETMTTKHQGRIIVESGEAGGYLVMTPDGVVTRRATVPQVLALARKWGRDHMDGATVGLCEVEWRGCGPALRKP